MIMLCIFIDFGCNEIGNVEKVLHSEQIDPPDMACLRDSGG